ncbi:uncharacterized protein LOC133824773 [Humulus lupulus]|uniref:uncharacterized protein LOC133824773 n=1 Tax=Humulus lupulus TaxID=3486 RepID=UPI002B414336|nr:uncharacterized protein LOC133824773 [Humulus lupulus]
MAGLKFPFYVSFIYGRNTVEERKNLWHKLPLCTAHGWIVLGDFNAVFKANERNGGKPISKAEIVDSTQWFKSVVIDSWSKFSQGSGLKALYYKLLRLKHQLKQFNKDQIGDIGSQFQKAKSDFQEARLLAQCFPGDIALQNAVQSATELFGRKDQMYHSFLMQRSKIDWLRKGDSNTAYFHAYLKKRRAENIIASFINEQGNLVDNFSEVVSHFLNHFRSIMGSPSSAKQKIDTRCIALGPKLNIDQQLSLLKPFSHQEIRTAIFSIPCIKSPGPDGFGSGFNVAGGKIPEGFLDTTLSLVPKCENPSKASDYRPIACCSTIYKCISKLICSRLAKVLPVLVQANQGAFVKDDLLLFCKGTLASVQVLKKALEEFSSVSGLVINTSKSHVYFGGIPADQRQKLATELQLTEGSFPLKYLGVPMRPTKWKHEDCDIIDQKFRVRIHSWASRYLSFAGRIQLIHSVLFGLRNYWMGIFILPQSIIKEIEKLCRSFLWGVNGNRNKIHLASWNKVCLPKAYGGLGFRNGLAWNKEILAKYIWAITEKPDLLWVKWINAIYLKGATFWSYQVPQDTSWYWKKLCKLREVYTYREIIAAGHAGKFQSAQLYNSSLCQQQVHSED